MATIRLLDVDPVISDLIGDAAKRKGMLKHAFINELLSKASDKEKALQDAASNEYAQQQCDTARTSK